MLLIFIVHLHASKLTPASIILTMSAVGYFHKINGFTDPATSFLVTKLLAGARNLGAVPDVRLPVTLPMLGRLLGAIPVVFTAGYKCFMLRAMMVLAFRAYLRVGEMVPQSRLAMGNCLQLDDVLLSGDLITVSFRRIKHSAKQGPQSLQVKGGCITGTLISQATFLRDFQKGRGTVQAAFFAYPDGSPMMCRNFDDSLKQLLIFCGYQTSSFKGHSFLNWRCNRCSFER